MFSYTKRNSLFCYRPSNIHHLGVLTPDAFPLITVVEKKFEKLKKSRDNLKKSNLNKSQKKFERKLVQGTRRNNNCKVEKSNLSIFFRLKDQSTSV